MSSDWSVSVADCWVSMSPGRADFLARFVARSDSKAVSGASSVWRVCLAVCSSDSVRV